MRHLGTLAVLGFFLIACAPQPQSRGASFPSRPPEIISIIDDLKIQSFVTMEGRRILQVTDNRDQKREYRFYLAQFKNPNWIGAAAGSHVIYVQIKAARNAYLNRQVFLPGLRRILAHEIAHDLLNHAENRNNSAAEELAADRLGIILWKRLGWDCSYWIQRYETKQKIGVTSTLYPTGLQLRQARRLCPEAEERKRDDLKKEFLEADLLHKTPDLYVSPPGPK